jgi:hypothetical protein
LANSLTHPIRIKFNFTVHVVRAAQQCRRGSEEVKMAETKEGRSWFKERKRGDGGTGLLSTSLQEIAGPIF